MLLDHNDKNVGVFFIVAPLDFAIANHVFLFSSAQRGQSQPVVFLLSVKFLPPSRHMWEV